VALRQELSSRDADLETLRAVISPADGENANEDPSADTDESRDKLERDLIQLRDQADRQRESAQTELGAALTQRDQAQERVAALGIELDTANARLAERNIEVQEIAAQNMPLESATLRLQEEFSIENAHAENLSEAANAHQDELNESRERYEEIEERYEEAEQCLGKSRHFGRLVARRKELVTSLIAAMRAKSKANDALKAGLDSMRRYKATAQQTEQHLLAEIEQLKAAIGQAREANAKLQDANVDQRKQTGSEQRIHELEERVNTQAELVNSMEEEAQLAKVVQNDLTQKAAEAENALQQLRESSDTSATSFNADHNNDPLVIDALEQEIAGLREQLANGAEGKSAQAGGGASAEIEEKLARAEATIKELTFETAAWKRKYEFLSTDAPAAYQTQSALEK